jgi:hypothetical protein
MNPKVDPGVELGGKKVLKLLTLNLRLTRQECCSQDPSASIFDAPDNVGDLALVQPRRIGDGRDPLANPGSIGFVVFEFDPLGFFVLTPK